MASWGEDGGHDIGARLEGLLGRSCKGTRRGACRRPLTLLDAGRRMTVALAGHLSTKPEKFYCTFRALLVQ